MDQKADQKADLFSNKLDTPLRDRIILKALGEEGEPIFTTEPTAEMLKSKIKFKIIS